MALPHSLAQLAKSFLFSGHLPMSRSALPEVLEGAAITASFAAQLGKQWASAQTRISKVLANSVTESCLKI